ncbi:NOL8 family RNA-binding protein [Sporobolomyces koalae]|uniref:NOL8 family RNA-binding protein n=1 Tax=Sporobolomyces koalae TaxID=500713 RepID=UPI00317BA8A5
MSKKQQRQRPVLSDEPVLQRLHVGGLAPSVTPRELVARFSSFGEIKGDVDGLGTGPSGLPRNYAFFNLLTSEAKLQRCMSMLNGSMWKSHKLRIGPAKPNWDKRREEERRIAKDLDDPESELSATLRQEKQKKKRKLSSDPSVGYTAKRFEIVTPENIENHKGWILDSKPHSAVPLFPLVVRPSHPIYLPPKAATTSWTRGKSRAEGDDASKKRKEFDTGREKKPLIRIKRMRIDPRRFGRKKVVYSEKEECDTIAGVGYWECLEDEHGDAAEVTWVFRARNGQVKHQETVKLNHRDVAHTDQFTALLERLQVPECAKPRPAADLGVANEEQSTLSAELAKIPLAAETKVDVETLPLTSMRARSLSPPPYVPSAPRQLLYNEEDAFQLRVSSLDDSTREEEARKERERLVQLALGVIPEEAAQVEGAPGSKTEVKKLPMVEGFANDDEDDDDDIFQQPAMRLRGGGGAADSSSDSDSDSSDEEIEEAQPTEKAKTTLSKGTLKEMFKPQEEEAGNTFVRTASFSLFSGLDLELDQEDEDVEAEEAIPIPSALPAPPPKILPIYRQRAGFQQPEQAREGPGYSFFGLLQPEQDQLPENKKRENEKRLNESGVQDWWKSQTADEIDEAHAKLRENLRGFSRKRHREAVKRTKKSAKTQGGGARRTGGATGLGPFTLDSLANTQE